MSTAPPVAPASPTAGPLVWLRSLLFNILFFAVTGVLAIGALPLVFAPRRWLMAVPRAWSHIVVAMLRTICGVRLEATGLEHLRPAEGGTGVVVAAKHQSAFDTIIWLKLLPDPAYVLKQELLSIPVYGLLARHAEMIPVDRSGGGAALRRMVRAAGAALSEGRQVIIFPEGTRTAPGQRVPYQPGVVALAAATGAPVVPAATDSGLCWGRRAFLKRPGVIHVAVLPPLPAGLPRGELLSRLETAIETESQRLLESTPGTCG